MRTLMLASASLLFLLTACGDETKVKDRKMIVIAHHYPSYASCGLTLDLLLNATAFDDAVAYEPEEDVTCATYGRNEDDNTVEKSCHVKDFNSDTNDTCVIGVNYTDYADDLVDILTNTVTDSKK